MIILLLAAFALIALYAVPGLVERRWWRELLVFSLLYLSALVLAILMTRGVKLPYITVMITNIMTRVKAMF